jgi:hypothetical protein
MTCTKDITMSQATKTKGLNLQTYEVQNQGEKNVVTCYYAPCIKGKNPDVVVFPP